MRRWPNVGLRWFTVDLPSHVCWVVSFDTVAELRVQMTQVGLKLYKKGITFAKCSTKHTLPNKQNICMTFVQCCTNVEDAGTTLYKYHTNVLCLLGIIIILTI